MVKKLTSNYRRVSYIHNFIQYSSLTVNSIHGRNYWGHQYGFRRNRSTTDQIFYNRQKVDKKWEHNGPIYQLIIGLRKVYDSVRREVLYNILTECGIPMKIIRLIKMYLNEIYSKVRSISYSEWSETRCFIATAFQLRFRICHQEGPRKSVRFGTEENTSATGLC
jgi:hypothetical protein